MKLRSLKNNLTAEKFTNFFFIPLFLIVLIDQSTKYIAPNFFNVSCNFGFGFGIGENFSLISVPILILIFFLIFKEKNKIQILAFTLIFSGGISNLIDRLKVGCVRDFLLIPFFSSFNFADVIISAGVIVLVYNMFSEILKVKNIKNKI